MSFKDIPQILTLTPGSVADKANRVLQKLENALNNQKVQGFLILDNEIADLLEYVLELEGYILMDYQD